MNRYTIRLPAAGPEEKGAGPLRCPTIGLAMVVTEINLTSGAAEIWDGSKRIARLEKQPATGAPFWKVN